MKKNQIFTIQVGGKNLSSSHLDYVILEVIKNNKILKTFSFLSIL